MKNLGLTKKQKEWLDAWGRKRSPRKTGYWRYRPATGLVDVIGNFDCASTKVSSNFKGVRFGKVSGYFNCQHYYLGSFKDPSNTLTSLEGAPQEVCGYFDCQGNTLTSLEGSPQKVGGYFLCRDNNLTSLEGAPQKVDGYFDCSGNNLTSLKGAPQKVGGSFHCAGNNLTSLKGSPQEVGEEFECGAFRLEKGEWNPKGWLKVLKEGSPKAQKLILTILSADTLNKEIQKDPARMIMNLRGVWNDENFKETRSKLVFPKGYQDDMDLVGDMSDVGF